LGEGEAALVEALEARALAATPADQYWAEMDTAGALSNLAWRCPLDPRSASSSKLEKGGDSGCQRVFKAAEEAYGQAARTADSQGWLGFGRLIRAQADNQAAQRALTDFKWDSDRAQDIMLNKLGWNQEKLSRMFAPRSRNDVLVTQRFDWEAPSSIAQFRPDWVELMEKAEAARVATIGGPDAESFRTRGSIAEIRGQKVEAAKLFARAAAMMDEVRAGFFDPRRRGTVIETDRGQTVESLGLRQLALKQEDEAFATFESSRARGLGELRQSLARDVVTISDRNWLATLLLLEARASKIEEEVVRGVLTNSRLDPPADRLAELAEIRAARRTLLRQSNAARARLARADYTPASLAALQQAAAKAGVSVMIYWTTATSVIVWYIGPKGTEVRHVTLPNRVLREKLQRVLQSAQDPNRSFDVDAARELYFYLIAPLDHLIDSRQLLIIPQGPLVNLPFETLIEPETSKPLIERWAVSYAPNATMALDILTRPAPRVTEVTAVADIDLDDRWNEMSSISVIKGLRSRVHYSQMVAPSQLGDALAGSESVHLLLHGKFNTEEPLLSELLNDAGEHYMYAAQLIGLPLRGVKLAVLSACESGQVGQRASNEIFGFPWVLLTGGVGSVVLSRWRVEGGSNATWMRHFYSDIAGGASPALAAATAMRTMRSNGHDHPYHWAAMQVSGR